MTKYISLSHWGMFPIQEKSTKQFKPFKARPILTNPQTYKDLAKVSKIYFNTGNGACQSRGFLC